MTCSGENPLCNRIDACMIHTVGWNEDVRFLPLSITSPRIWGVWWESAGWVGSGWPWSAGNFKSPQHGQRPFLLLLEYLSKGENSNIDLKLCLQHESNDHICGVHNSYNLKLPSVHPRQLSPYASIPRPRPHPRVSLTNYRPASYIPSTNPYGYGMVYGVTMVWGTRSSNEHVGGEFGV